MKSKLSQYHIDTFFTLLKGVVLIAVFLMLFFKFRNEQQLFEKMWRLVQIFVSENWYLLIVVLILMPFNWLIEAIKWQLLASPIINLSLSNAFKGVLSGLSVGFITPHGIGEYVGKLAVIKHTKKNKLIGGILLGRVIQMTATVCFGLWGLSIILGIKTALLYVMVMFFIAISIYLLYRVSIGKRYFKHWFGIIAEYSSRQIVSLFLLSFCRYLIFAFQFVLVLHAFDSSINWFLHGAGATWVFLAKSILPTFNFLSDLGIREYSAVYFYEQLGADTLPAVCASLFIWIINILVPTLCGLPIVLQLKAKND